jgi:hypothetical protein
MYRIRLKLFTDAGFTLIPGKGNSGSKVLIRKSILLIHREMITDYKGTRRNRIFIRYHLIIRGRRRIMLISFGGLLASRNGLEFCCLARVCIILYLMYRVSALLSIICVSYAALHVVTFSSLRSTQTSNPDMQYFET